MTFNAQHIGISVQPHIAMHSICAQILGIAQNTSIIVRSYQAVHNAWAITSPFAQKYSGFAPWREIKTLCN